MAKYVLIFQYSLKFYWSIIVLCSRSDISREVCIDEELHITCPSDEIILMTSAEYGRKEVGRCITKADQYIGCTNDVLGLLDQWCSGRRECRTAVATNADLNTANINCLEFLKVYLKFQYECRKGQFQSMNMLQPYDLKFVAIMDM